MSAPSQSTDTPALSAQQQQPADAPPVYGSPPSDFEAQQPKNMDGQPEGGPHVMSATDQNDGNDAAAEALVREFEAYDFGNDAEFRKGLPAILKQAKGKSADIDAIIGRAQWFYFGKLRGVSVPFEVYRKYRKGELESRPMGTNKKFGSLMSGGQGAPSGSPSSGSAPTPGSQSGQGPSGAGAIGAAAGGATQSQAQADQAGRKGSVSVHGEGISVVSAEDDVAVTRAAVVVESSGVQAAGTAGEPSNDMPFDQVVRLIQEGRANEVPRKEIPEGLNDEPASESKMAPRRKPWETASTSSVPAASNDTPSQTAGSAQPQGEAAQQQAPAQ
ncbi:hypothetical protein A1Q1_07546 [Trichosporon asahii var. asahii CBS 2479]|uniref:Uncharacterized protein n=1 Tax=Trichosporon asahii var. asahii (strain ATCC 90039 / CBS 2479 / JCM 2466 / KCTC 7840 / NBRC 103889/ NCYC 2677 / UAMH 7654) TaxID=1186058 RepID=J5R8K1_TRIAS|nr:hypothetical protein A1Q1_07546 [Trichosporon asahii var. asahii CBS 2479]EJT51268.1 hypothetical protein A1Q1_07546 [Trichosporon asahii var. asahii CBS 2479]